MQRSKMLAFYDHFFKTAKPVVPIAVIGCLV